MTTHIARNPAHEAGLCALYRDLKLSIEYRPIESLKAYATNPRSHPRRQLKALIESVRAFGFIAPIVVDESNSVVGGHGVLLAAKELGYTEVPTVRLTHLGEAEKKALRIGLNRSAELAGWDHKLLALEFKSLIEIDTNLSLDFDLKLTGFSLPEIDRIIEDDAEDASDDFVAEPGRREPPVSRRGDTWLLDEHRLINGDARDPATYAALLGDERAAVGLHDAPWNLRSSFISKSGRHQDFICAHGELSEEAFTDFLTEFLRQARAHSKPGAVQFSFSDWRHMGEMLKAGQSAGLVQVNLCVWDKGSGALGSLFRSQHELVFVFADPTKPVQNNVQLGKFGRNRTNVWSWPGAASLRKELQLHPTPKPVGLLAEAIRDVSNRGDIVLDSFSGSGSTIIAAAKTKRRGYAIELDPHYVDVGVRRWQEWSGGTARHAETRLTFEQLEEARRAGDGSQVADAPEGHEAGATAPARIRHRARVVQANGDDR
jgi:hypothetical protein